MKLQSLFILFAAALSQINVAATDERVPVASPVGPGKQDGTVDRKLSVNVPKQRGWSSSTTTKSSKTSKSTDYPTLFPTQFPTLFPTASPTYCGKASKSWWHGKWNRNLDDWSTKTSKSESCYSGSRSWSGNRRQLRGGNNRSFHNKRNLKEDEHDLAEARFKSGDTKERRRINGGKPIKSGDQFH